MSILSRETPLSPKVIGSVLASLIAGSVLAMLGYLQTPDGQAYLVGLPQIVVVGLNAFIPALAVAIAGYFATDPLRKKGKELEEIEQMVEESGAKRALVAQVVAQEPATKAEVEQILTEEEGGEEPAELDDQSVTPEDGSAPR